MAKGQMRGNREAKKPKQDKPKHEAAYLAGENSRRIITPVKPTGGKR